MTAAEPIGAARAPSGDGAPVNAHLCEAFLREQVGAAIHLVSIVPDGRISACWFGADAPAATRWAMAENEWGRNIYWTANIVGTALNDKPGKKDIAAARFAHADIDPPEGGGVFDREAVLARLAALDCPPSLVIDSGNGFQPLWRLGAALTDWLQVENINKAIAVHFGADHCHNIDRLLRLPGTINYPNRKKRAAGRVPVLASLTHASEATYSPAELVNAFGVQEDVFAEARANEGASEGASGGADEEKDARGGAEHANGAAFDDVELLTADDLELPPLSSIRSVIEHPRGHDRSADGLRCARDMLRAGFSPKQVAGILLNPKNRVSAHYLEQKDPRRAACRAIERVLSDAGRAHAGATETQEQQAPDGTPQVPAFSDEGLALKYADRHAHEMRHVAKWGQWLAWDGKRWNEDATLLAFSLSRAICRETAALCDKGARERIASAKTVAAVVALARSDRRLAAVIDQWDADPWLLNTPGGVVDLRTGAVSPHRPGLHMTKIAAVASGDGCPTWARFLARVTAENRDLQSFIQRVCGYALTGDVSEHALFFLFGHGANGKSVLLETVSGILADYHTSAPIETFTASNTDRHPTELAMLRGARLVTAVETEEGRRWAESKIKALTGGDKISARFMRQDYFTFQPQFKLLIAGNHKPGLRSIDEAIRRRLHLIPFSVTIPPEERDPALKDKLKNEWPGILRWMIDGCLEWQRIGLAPPQAVLSATAEYLDGEDALSAWIDECCVRDPQAWASSTSLYNCWKRWADGTGEHAGSGKRFAQALETRGFQPLRKMNGRGFQGIRTNDTEGAGAYDAYRNARA